MIHGTINTLDVDTRSGIAKKSGAPWSMRSQAILLTFASGEVRKFDLTLDDNADPLPLGKYKPKDTAVYLDGYALTISGRARDWVKA